MNTMKESKTTMEELNDLLKQDAEMEVQRKMERYWDQMGVANKSPEDKAAIQTVIDKLKGKDLFPDAVERAKNLTIKVGDMENPT